MSRKGMRHYSPYNLRSRGSRQTFECLPTPSGSPTRPRSSATNCDTGGLRAPASNSMYDTARQAVLDGMPLDVLCHSVLLNLARSCAETAQAVYDEQRRIILAFDAEESVSDNELKLFYPGAAEHVKHFGICAHLVGPPYGGCGNQCISHKWEVAVGLVHMTHMDNIVEADFHTDVRILPHKVTDVALMQLPDSPVELQPTFRKRFLPLHHVLSEHNLPHAHQQRASHASHNGTGTSTVVDAEPPQPPPQTTPGTSVVVPATGDDLTLHRFVRATSRKQPYGWFEVAGLPSLTLPPSFRSDQPVEIGDLFLHRPNDSVSFWICTRTQPLTWEPIAIGDAWLLDHTRFLIMQEEKPAWVLLETSKRYKRYQRRSKDADV
ncbi:hypothetical protein PISMIDRAFT_25542 [Pisolithus microcarpus 441]|uniref:Unplaced genomic scaffold scaffold_309, whole genome shotgun sequence n=1 Tax=Pisolithus microcarpus 441 TaxID=765257 RepID=A0A0C9Y971_9AGAM|nr:hypothetical protein BKA83DRAFT_25542 [Pisolithus microcarpus]KIK13461.1 hypothetical protein PISMIDRAFT_25542 [Pisolithus microcarpus 441]